jgi:hypothetical protein
MFREDDYVNPDENNVLVEAKHEGCRWVGTLYEHKSGGFDLYYSHETSDFEPLEAEPITRLRHLSESGADFIAHLEGNSVDGKMMASAKAQLLAWIRRVICP